MWKNNNCLKIIMFIAQNYLYLCKEKTIKWNLDKHRENIMLS